MGFFDFLGLSESAKCRNVQQKQDWGRKESERRQMEYEKEEQELLVKTAIWQKRAEDLMKQYPGEYFSGERIAEMLRVGKHKQLEYYYYIGGKGCANKHYTGSGCSNKYDREEKMLHGKILFCNTTYGFQLPAGFGKEDIYSKIYFYWKK